MPGIRCAAFCLTGRLVRYREPAASPTVRVIPASSGAPRSTCSTRSDDRQAGDLWAPTGRRPSTPCAKPDAYYIRGLATTSRSRGADGASRFQAGASPASSPKSSPRGFHGVDLDEQALADLVAVAAIVHHQYEIRAQPPHFPGQGSRVNGDWVVKFAGVNIPCPWSQTAAGYAVVENKRSRG